VLLSYPSPLTSLLASRACTAARASPSSYPYPRPYLRVPRSLRASNPDRSPRPRATPIHNPRLYVKSLYRRYLTNALNWYIRRDLWRQRAIEIRAEFERNRCVAVEKWRG
jgi:hypothetical protein